MVGGERGSDSEVVVRDPRMIALRDDLGRIARGDLGVLLLGETGVGKDVLAALVHGASPRAGAPFVTLNCAALTVTLVESELFGHERGAFTGADAARPGLLELADGGTLLLDEVGELPMGLQPKLLRAIEDGRVRRVGGRTSIAVDVRFVAATNRDLPREVACERFRADLYYRLAGIAVVVPPLRERRCEIEPLARHFAGAASRALGRPVPAFSACAREQLLRYPWPGNVRQLANVVQRAVMLCPDALIEPHHLRLDPISSPSGGVASPPVLGERERILAALEFSQGNQTRAAALLGVSRRTLLNRLDRYDLPRPRKAR